MTPFDRHNIRGWLISEIETYLLITGEDKRLFCDRAAGNPDVLDQLKAGRSPRIDTVERILKAIDGAS